MGLGQRTNSQPTTVQRIRDHARAAFNDRGVGAVRIRDIARDLGLSPGNVSYHFATKERLVAALMEEAHGSNEGLVDASAEPFGFDALLRLLQTFMRRDLENRWAMRDFAGLLIAMPALRGPHEQMQRAREARVDAIVARLVAAGLLDRRRTQRALPELRLQLLTQVFFWLPAAIVTAPDRDPAERLDAHSRAALALFRAYCTPTGRRGPLLGLGV
jgi:AcrR family transcriptional regulator